eukprot:CAMPEP_0114130148 /NCGR_PEP_ID=MMETSP0043_2-20121206/11858_1 /TAXON_ID=464988 /ORGANISM="Hemiselmis andersenii, Strain CCMP644" /LENGTH=61 /DNA_ID=CAMNT_0001223479 /DNA_START=412 /DNA_END=597 /DNA_ORIENTATION=-
MGVAASASTGGVCGGLEQLGCGIEQAKHVEDILNLDNHRAGPLRSTLQDGCQGFKAWSACM